MLNLLLIYGVAFSTILLNYDIINEGKETISYIRENAQILADYLNHNNYIKKSIFIPSARVMELSMMVSFLEIIDTKNYPKIFIRILNKGFFDNVNPFFKVQLINLIKKNFISLYSECEELAFELNKQYDISCKKLLLPCFIYNQGFQTSFKNSSEFTIGFLGTPRSNKGVSKLPAIIREFRKIINLDQSDFKIKFLLQIGSLKKRRKIIFFLKEFLSKHLSQLVNVEIVDNNDNNDDFIRTLTKVDIFLLPYSLKSYRFAGSGFIIDGIMLNKPIVYTNGIAMNEYLCKGNALSASSPKEFAIALKKIIDNYDLYQKNVKACSKIIQLEFEKTKNLINKF